MAGRVTLSKFMDWIISRNPGETEFHQAVTRATHMLCNLLEYSIFCRALPVTSLILSLFLNSMATILFSACRHRDRRRPPRPVMTAVLR